MTTTTDLYAVTDQHAVIPLRITSKDHIRILTEINMLSPTQHMQTHHDFYFKYIYLDDNGRIPKTDVFETNIFETNIFETKREAETYALIRLEQAINLKFKEVKNLLDVREKLIESLSECQDQKQTAKSKERLKTHTS